MLRLVLLTLITAVLIVVTRWPAHGWMQPSLRLAKQQTQKSRTSPSSFLRSSPNSSPVVIGILSQPLVNKSHSSSYDYIAASYVKWLEAAGASSIVIPYDATPDLLDNLYNEIHGVLLPGGAAEFPPHLSDLLDLITYRLLWENDYMPVWGTCLGFEFMIQYIGGDTALQSGFIAENVSLPLENLQQYELYNNVPIEVLRDVQSNNLTLNNHHQGIEPQSFEQNDHLMNAFRISSINHDDTGRPFVSTIEPINASAFSFYGVQYHPEKSAFEYATYPHTNIPYEAINHSRHAIDFSLYLANFFVDKAKKSSHQYSGRFPLIANTYPIQMGTKFEEIFLIPKDASHSVSSG